MVSRGGGWRWEVGKSGQKITNYQIQDTSSEDVTYSIVTMVNNTVLYICKLLREQILKVLIVRKKNVLLCEVMNVN